MASQVVRAEGGVGTGRVQKCRPGALVRADIIHRNAELRRDRSSVWQRVTLVVLVPLSAEQVPLPRAEYTADHQR
jgi:hypothetical protein